MEKSEKEGRLFCKQCQDLDLFREKTDYEEEYYSYDPILGTKGRWACIYHGELDESQFIFVPYPDEASRVKYLNHVDRVLKKLGMGKYTGQGNTVSSQEEVLLRMEELKSDLKRERQLSVSPDLTCRKWWKFWK